MWIDIKLGKAIAIYIYIKLNNMKNIIAIFAILIAVTFSNTANAHRGYYRHHNRCRPIVYTNVYAPAPRVVVYNNRPICPPPPPRYVYRHYPRRVAYCPPQYAIAPKIILKRY